MHLIGSKLFDWVLGFGSNSTLREKVHVDACQYSGRFVEDSDIEESEFHGSGHERRHEGHAEYEQANEVARNPEDHDGVREAIRNHGHERGDDVRRDW